MKYSLLLRGQAAALETERAALRSEVEAITADAETRSLTEADEARLNEIVLRGQAIAADIDAKTARADELDALDIERAQAPQGQAPAFHRAESPFAGVDARSVRGLTDSDLEQRAQRALDGLKGLNARQKEHVAARLEDPSINGVGQLARHLLLTGSPEYRTGFGKIVTNNPYALTGDEQRAMSIGTDNAGGYLMPFTLDPTLIDTNAGVANPIRQVARIRTTMTDNWQGVSSGGVTASWDAEASEVSDDTPTLAQPAITIKHPRAFIPFSIEAQDDFSSLLSDLTAEAGRAKDRLESAGFATGSGSGANPTGLITALVAASKVVASATTDTFAVADLYSTQGAVPDRYDDNATWLMNKTIINLARQFGTADSHALLTHLGDGSPTQLLGANLVRWSSLDGAINATADNYIAVYGDVSECYSIVDRLGMTVELIPHLFATANNLPSGQRGLYVRWRVGAGVVNADACRVLNVT